MSITMYSVTGLFPHEILIESQHTVTFGYINPAVIKETTIEMAQ